MKLPRFIPSIFVLMLVLSPALASDMEILSGHWQGSTNTHLGMMTVESVFQRDGTFQVLTTSSFAKVLMSGHWEIVSDGMYRQRNEEWFPTHDSMGNEIHMPLSESHTYRILDRNRVLIDGQTVMTRVGY